MHLEILKHLHQLNHFLYNLHLTPGDVVVDHLQKGMEDQRLVRQDFGAGECWF